jgi:hypothetical protein
VAAEAERPLIRFGCMEMCRHSAVSVARYLNTLLASSFMVALRRSEITVVNGILIQSIAKGNRWSSCSNGGSRLRNIIRHGNCGFYRSL